MAKRPPVQGYNHDFRHQGLVYHVQTEDYGVDRRKVVSQLFYSGAIVAVVSADYSPGADDEASVRKQMQGQHKALMRQLLRGKLEVQPPPAQQPAAPPLAERPAPPPAKQPAPPPARQPGPPPAEQPAPPPARQPGRPPAEQPAQPPAARTEPLRPTLSPEPVREDDPVDQFLFAGSTPSTVPPQLTAEDWQLLDALIEDFSDGHTPIAGIELRRRAKRLKTLKWVKLDSDLDDL